MKALFLFFLCFCLWVFSDFISDPIEYFSGVPSKIAFDAIQTPGFFNVLIFGTDKERHYWAKGYSTSYGHMVYSTDDYLKYNRHWSEEHIHSIGHAYGFSPLWNGRHQ